MVVDGDRYPIVNRFTRNFDQKIYMIRGNPAAVEHVELNPNSPLLQLIYNELEAQIEDDDSTANVLEKISKITQFHIANYEKTDEFISEILSQNQNSRIIPKSDTSKK